MDSFPHKEGSIHQTNFDHTISDDDFKRKVLQSFKDEYLLDFIKIEDPEDVDERVIGQSIIQNTKNFIMAFGNDFAFMGNQHYLEVDDCIPLRGGCFAGYVYLLRFLFGGYMYVTCSI